MIKQKKITLKNKFRPFLNNEPPEEENKYKKKHSKWKQTDFPFNITEFYIFTINMWKLSSLLFMSGYAFRRALRYSAEILHGVGGPPKF